MNKNKIKRFIMIYIILIISMIYVSIRRTDRNIGDAVQVTTLPVSGKVVILDAGHQKVKMGRLKHKLIYRLY